MRVCITNVACGHPDNLHAPGPDGLVRCDRCGAVCGKAKAPSLYEEIRETQGYNLGLTFPVYQTADRPMERGERRLEDFASG